MPGKPRVCSVTVAFNPDPRRLETQIAALRGQVDTIIVVDNGSQIRGRDFLRGLADAHDPAIRVLSLPRNEGVAGGLNRGIAAAAGAEYVLLLDHDSVPTPGMVEALLAAHRAASANAQPVAAVGPRIRDSRDQHEFPFIRLGWMHNSRVRCAGGSGVVACDFLITSGSLISTGALDRIGPFDETLFIDFVDLEWCCRARAAGYSLYGACAAALDHELGQEPRTVLGGLRILVHSPERIYYATRNRMLLYRCAHVPLKWKLKDAPRGVIKLATALLFVAPRGEYLRMAGAAVRDGARGAGGARLRP